MSVERRIFSKMILDFGKANRRPDVRCRERTNKNVRSNPRSVRHQGARAPDKHSTSLESARSSELPSQVRQPFLAGNNLRTLRFSRGKKQTLLFCFCQQKKHTEKKSRFWPFKKVCRTKQALGWSLFFLFPRRLHPRLRALSHHRDGACGHRERSSRPPHALQHTAGKMASPSSRALAAVVAAFALTATNVVQQAEAHPNCLGDFAPDNDVSSSFCPADNPDGFCCTPQQETAIETNYNNAGATGRCAEMYQEVRIYKRPTIYLQRQTTHLLSAFTPWRGFDDVSKACVRHRQTYMQQCLPRATGFT